VSGFVHLHTHTTWSLLDGAIPAEVLPHFARDLGFDAVAMTDHDSLLGAVRFSKACRDAGVKPIFGAELTTDSGHLTAIAKNATGYGNLCRLITQAHLSNERGRPTVPVASVAERSEGLFILSGCERGRVARLAASGRVDDAERLALEQKMAFGDGYRIEVFDHRGRARPDARIGRGYGHRALRDRLLKIAKDTGIPAVATNDVHYGVPSEAGTHELLHAMKDIVPLSKSQTLRPNSEYFLKTAVEMRDLFYDAPDAIDETLRIADECEFDLDLGSYHFPRVPLPPGESPTGYLARRCYAGAERRYGRITNEVEERLQHELRMIHKMGFPEFFLLVADIVDHVRSLGIRCACRGSAAASLVCFVLGISDVDPIRYDLLFERFMNTRRDELPDIDVDVESHRREEVLEYILTTYGAEQTAVCCMVDTFRARMAIREVGKALGMPAEELDIVAKSFPRIAARDIPKAIERLPELVGSNLRAGQLEQLFELCLAIDGFPRHLALHPSGVILSSSDLAERVPMQESFQGFTMLQADKDDVEELGLVKLDVLGVRMLSSISHAQGEIERTTGERIDVDALPRDDKATFDLIRSSRTLGCFQIESPGQRELLARYQPDRFEDLIIDISLFRPGPVKSDMVSPFLERRHGFELVHYPHPKLAPILRETNGVVVFHEQVIRVIAAATGCSMDDADHVRRHLDADRPSVPGDPGHSGRVHREPVHGPITIDPPDEGVERWFKSCALRNGFTQEQVDSLWREVFSFASFGFCKAHAAAFALPTYISAWLKAHYPAEFLAGVLTHDPGMYPRRLIVADARHFGVPILPIDVNRSDKVYRAEPIVGSEAAGGGTPLPYSDSPHSLRSLRNSTGAACRRPRVGERRGIRLALSEVREMSEAELESLLHAREEGGRFTSIEDLWRRTELSRPVLEHLVHLGALDSVETKRSRRELLWRVIELSSEPKVKAGGQLAFGLDEPIQENLPGLAPYTPLEETEAELEISGIDARRHIMDLYRDLTAEIGCTRAAELGRKRNDSEVWVAGVKVASQTPAIRSGQRIIFITLDDPTGPLDATVFERVQARCARTVFHSWLLLLRGVVRKRGGASLTHETDPNNVGITVVVNEAFDLAEVAKDRKAGHSLAAALGRQRRRQLGGQPDAVEGDLKPASKLWHSSGGSAGR
jgi:error-prone DNA polymerase